MEPPKKSAKAVLAGGGVTVTALLFYMISQADARIERVEDRVGEDLREIRRDVKSLMMLQLAASQQEEDRLKQQLRQERKEVEDGKR